MKIKINFMVYLIPLLGIYSCTNNTKADAYGNFEATEVTVSAQANGQLLKYNVDDGYQLKKNQEVGYIDTIPLNLERKQLLASKQIVYAKSKGVLSQISVLKAQLVTANDNLTRIKKLIKSKSATQKQLDDASGKVNVLTQQIKSIETQNKAVVNEAKQIDAQLGIVADKIQKSILKNPIKGTVLVNYAEQGEIATFGKPLYTIANLSSLNLRVYIAETQLSSIKIGQKVTVKIDAKNHQKKYEGIVTWIASKAEFTPKIIQTKEARVNLVYAVKIKVKNDGFLKIGMPAEMWISSSNH